MNAGRYAELQTTSSAPSLPLCFKGFLRAFAPGPQQARGWLSIYSTAFLGFRPIGCLIAGSLSHVFYASHVIAGMCSGWNNWDQLGMMQQLGVVPGPVDMDRLLDKPA